MVESMIRYSKSGLSINALNMRSQTPFLAQRRKRWKTLFQLPNDGGRSRQGAPARAIQSTASTNRRLSSPCRPLSPCLPVTNGSMRRHCAFVNCRRIKITPSVAILNHIREPRGIPYMSTGPNTPDKFPRRSSASDTRPNPNSCRLSPHDLQAGMVGSQLARTEDQTRLAGPPHAPAYHHA